MKQAYFKETLMAEGEMTDEELRAAADAEAINAGIIDEDADDDEEAYPRVTWETFRAELTIND